MTAALSILVIGAVLAAGTASAQQAPARAPNRTVTTSSAEEPVPPLPGANSYSQEQARRLIERSGFSAIADLHQDGQSIWRARALRDGALKFVAVDYKGNVVSQEFR